MFRRDFIASVLPLLGVGCAKQIPLAPLPTDYEYATADNPITRNVIPLLNGKPMKGIKEANAKEGWMIQIVTDTDKNGRMRPFADGKYVRERRLTGRVQLMNQTPELKARFDAEKDVL